VSKETYTYIYLECVASKVVSVKEKGAKETYYQSKRDLLSEEKRPIIRGKATYYQRKSDL